MKSLGVCLDASLTFAMQVITVAGQALFYLCQVHQLDPFLPQPELATMICATVTSRIDYHYLLYAGLPLKALWRLQVVQNAVSGFLTATSWSSHIQPI